MRRAVKPKPLAARWLVRRRACFPCKSVGCPIGECAYPPLVQMRLLVSPSSGRNPIGPASNENEFGVRWVGYVAWVRTTRDSTPRHDRDVEGRMRGSGCDKARPRLLCSAMINKRRFKEEDPRTLRRSPRPGIVSVNLTADYDIASILY